MAACGQTMAHLPQSMQMSGPRSASRWRWPASRTGRPGREAAVRGEGRHRQQVALAGHDHGASRAARTRGADVGAPTVADRAARRGQLARGSRPGQLGAARRRWRRSCAPRWRGPACRRSSHRPLISADRLVGRQDAREGEEAGLHHRVDAAAELGLGGDLVGVDDPELRCCLS